MFSSPLLNWVARRPDQSVCVCRRQKKREAEAHFAKRFHSMAKTGLLVSVAIVYLPAKSTTGE